MQGVSRASLAQAKDDRAQAVGADAGVKDGVDMIELLSALLDLASVERTA